MSLLVLVFGRRQQSDTPHAQLTAVQKAQGTKSREVGHQLGSERYVDLMRAPTSMIDVTLAGFDLGVWTYGRSAE